MPRLLSVNVGLPRDVTWNGKTVRTAVWKSPVTGRRTVHQQHLELAAFYPKIAVAYTQIATIATGAT